MIDNAPNFKPTENVSPKIKYLILEKSHVIGKKVKGKVTFIPDNKRTNLWCQKKRES